MNTQPAQFETEFGERSDQRNGGKVARMLILAYGVISYAIFFATFLYAVGFMGGFLVPVSLDTLVANATVGDLVVAAFIDLGLLAVFALQHSIMARPAFKKAWTRIIPPAAERSTYVLLSSAALLALFAFWQPLGGVVRDISSIPGKVAMYAGFAFGWGLVFVSTCLINHFDLFGLRQVWLAARNKPYTELEFVTPWAYRVIRHPLYLGWFFAMWCTPVMSAAHLFFAAVATAYIFVGIRLEEKDLQDAHPDYATYKEGVPMVLPTVDSLRNSIK